MSKKRNKKTSITPKENNAWYREFDKSKKGRKGDDHHSNGNYLYY